MASRVPLLPPPSSLLLLLCLAVSAAGNVPAPAVVSKPGCPTRCGAVDIPFPFGIGDHCGLEAPYTNYPFKFNCVSVDGTSKPFFRGMEVTKISMEDGKAWMKMNISKNCYDQSTGTMKDNTNTTSVHFGRSPFWISDKDNKIIVIGCETFSYMQINNVLTGCVPSCGEDPKNGICSLEAGCCKLDFPNGTWYYNAFFNKNNSTSPCSYITVMETTTFNFNQTYFKSTAFYDTYKGLASVSLDWIITMDSCDKVERNTTSYACVSERSSCVNDPKGGYRCKCSDGYEGNPYVKDGCQDINECLDNATYPCPGICNNTLGNFTCSCYPGSYMMNGVCLLNQKSGFPRNPVIGASVGAVVLVIVITYACFMREKRKLQHVKRQYFRQHGGMLLFEEMKSQQGISFKIFSEEELQQATNKFDKQQVLGQGGNATVYKGLLKGNKEIAVKRCMTIDMKQKKEFGKEMLILSQINHRNIVKLLGCCLEIEVPMLIYEFIPNGTLFSLIHHNHNQRVSLETRLRIAHESAEALAYLHSWASPPILHGDVKSSNILLDKEYTAKVSDFGASILAPTDESQFVTLVQGTCGYLDPEYMQTCQLTDKSDVYSFGVVLLELLTRKKAFNLESPEDERSLAMRFLSAMKENKLSDILDDQIMTGENLEFLEEIAELAKQCLEMSGENRPLMKEVAEKLDRLRKVMKHPWEQQNPEEMESLLGHSSYKINSDLTIEHTGNFSINSELGVLESGR
ncbi:wall-associated receptor kinase 3-like [Oryza brachyantha]|uniref:wall-associated receptor kinase 3-like n=1 Tax=Oryza brachyantha TaxID=4533 RepID=UPI001AD9EABC|nr:wall-associated receptor kinase 3-like [Oryza brachyantha]